MRAVIQRVSHASVTANGVPRGEVGLGLMVLLGIEDADGAEDISWLCRKIVGLRIFSDVEGVMNLSVVDVGGGILLVSQFTLMASTQKGNRPSYLRASKPALAEPLYEQMVQELGRELGKPVATGLFGADMQVSLVNDGPVTIWVDTKNRE
ncbi:MAG: D-tyrosyl-tRNA(Tyr) deacylase [Bacteroidetes bacterium]|nr:D-tyrosyl-tRNA(Tyr) deacylase [Bacteroidota bacterium]